MPNTATLPPKTEMYDALVRRDAAYEGVFVAAIRTTGIFCRPTCGAKKPRHENVEYFPSPRDATLSGYRPCRRCKPLTPAGAEPDWLRRLLETIDRDPGRRWTDSDIERMGESPTRVRRWFKQNHDMTFHAYQRARRLGHALQDLGEGDDINRAAYEHGFDSPSGFRDAVFRLFGEPAGKLRNANTICVKRILTPLGPMIVGATERGLCLLEFADRRMLEKQLRTLARKTRGHPVPSSNEHLQHVERELSQYFEGALRDFTVPVVAPGTEFQEKCWDWLRTIPYAETRSYSEQAAEIGRPGAQRAVGRANGMNRIAIVIPCHRVVRDDGKLAGYGGGLWRKKALLRLQRKYDSGIE